MSVNSRIEAVGLKDALRELNKLDKRARRAITKDFKLVAAPAVETGTKLIPTAEQVPSGLNRSWTPKKYQLFPYKPREMKFGSKLSGRKPKESIYGTKNLATFSLVFSGPGEIVIDLTGVGKKLSEKGKALAAALDKKMGRTPSRITWRAYDENAAQMEGKLQDLIDRVMRDLEQAQKFWKEKSDLTGGLYQ